jgi:hypothetical protein
MEERLAKLISYTEHLLDAFLGLAQKTTVFLPMVDNSKVKSKYAGGHRAEGFRVLRFALFSSCAQDIIKLTIDNDKRSPSVTNVMTILADESIRHELRKRYSVWVLPWEPGSKLNEEDIVKFERQEQTRLLGEFDQTFLELQKAWDDFNAQPWVTGLLKLRDKNTAHLEITKTEGGYKPVAVESLGLKWGDLGEAVNRLEGLVLKVNVISRQAGFAIEDAKAQFDRTSKAFWGLLANNG